MTSVVITVLRLKIMTLCHVTVCVQNDFILPEQQHCSSISLSLERCTAFQQRILNELIE